MSGPPRGSGKRDGREEVGARKWDSRWEEYRSISVANSWVFSFGLQSEFSMNVEKLVLPKRIVSRSQSKET